MVIRAKIEVIKQTKTIRATELVNLMEAKIFFKNVLQFYKFDNSGCYDEATILGYVLYNSRPEGNDYYFVEKYYYDIDYKEKEDEYDIDDDIDTSYNKDEE